MSQHKASRFPVHSWIWRWGDVCSVIERSCGSQRAKYTVFNECECATCLWSYLCRCESDRQIKALHERPSAPLPFSHNPSFTNKTWHGMGDVEGFVNAICLCVFCLHLCVCVLCDICDGTMERSVMSSKDAKPFTGDQKHHNIIYYLECICLHKNIYAAF